MGADPDPDPGGEGRLLSESRPLSVLVVEDEPEDRWLLGEAVRLRGHAVVSCEDAESGWRAFLSEHPGLVVLDLVLPGADGLELARRIRDSPHGRWTVILVVTARNEPGLFQRVLDAGVDDYLEKPIDIGRLDVRLAAAERSVRLRRDRRSLEDALVEKTKEIEELFENLSQGFFSIDLPSGRLSRVSSTVGELLDLPSADLESPDGRWREMLLPRSADAMPEPGEPVVRTLTIPDEDGDVRHLEVVLGSRGDAGGGPRRVDGLLADVTDRRRAQVQLALRSEELAALHRIGSLTLTSPSFEEAYEEILAEVTRTMRYPIGIIAHRDGRRDSLAVAAIHGIDPEPDYSEADGSGSDGSEPGDADRLVLGDTLAGITMREGRPLARTVRSHDDPGHPTLRRAAIRSWLSFPLHGGDEPEGILVLADTVDRAPDPRLLRLGRGVADNLSSFLDRLAVESALRESERRYRALSADLEAANQELEAFAYSVSHDLRVPLRTMQGFAHTLLREFGETLGPEGKGYLQRILRSGSYAEKLIDDLLDYSRLSADEVEREWIDLEQVVERAVETLASEIRERDGEIDVERPLPKVSGHHLTLVQVVTNLLSNAIKFVPDDIAPRVRIRAESHGGRCRLMVEDNGIGVPPDRREKIFGVFERLGGDAGTRPGTGIGLAIVRRAMEKLGGACGVEEGEGGGSVFWIELPADRSTLR